MGEKVEEAVTPNPMARCKVKRTQITRADDDISLLGNDRLNEQVYLIWKVLPITIQTDHDLWITLARSMKAGVEGGTLALIAFMANNGGTRRTSDPSGIVGGAIVNDDHLASKAASLEDDTANEPGFIVSRDDNDQGWMR
jgi:hypothetical protein